ncbi:MAG TPA: GrpB family protein [Gemmatimonadaceae bacterium]
MRTIVVLDYDPTWPEIFERLRSEIWPAVSDVALAVEHVGSTSVPGLAAKPIIDMSVVVPTDAEIAVAIERLATLGYVHRGNLGVEGREAFRSPDELPPHHLYLCPRDSIGLANHLAVRDYLRTHPEMATEYGALKKRLAREYPHDIDRYIDGKTDLILGILRASNFPAARLEAIERTNRMSVGQGGAPADSARRE